MCNNRKHGSQEYVCSHARTRAGQLIGPHYDPFVVLQHCMLSHCTALHCCRP
jgi:hypothetical protein